MEDYINKIFNMDCLEGMDMYPDHSIDMILCDLPYGVTNCRWDSLLPFNKLWKQYLRIIKDNGAIVLTACQPFTTRLISSQPKIFSVLLVLVQKSADRLCQCKENATAVYRGSVCVLQTSSSLQPAGHHRAG